MEIKTENLNKKFGKKTVLKDINFTVSKGQIYGLLGKNGAGKTTLINLLTDMLKPDSGSFSLDGMTFLNDGDKLKQRIGVMPDENQLIQELTGRTFIQFVAKLYGIGAANIKKRTEDLTTFFFESPSDLDKAISKLSTGLKKKVGLCSALIHTPDFLFLDEPFSGLDPIAASQLSGFLSKYQNGQRIIFVSSHDLNYVEKIATHIGVLENAQLVYNNNISDFTQNGKNTLDEALLNKLQPSGQSIAELQWI